MTLLKWTSDPLVPEKANPTDGVISATVETSAGVNGFFRLHQEVVLREGSRLRQAFPRKEATP